MAYLILSQHHDDLYVECRWVDGNGAHGRRATEELTFEQQSLIKNTIATNPEFGRWQIERHGDGVLVGLMKDGDTGPRYDYPLKKAKEVKEAASVLMEWCDAYCGEWRGKNEDYEESRELDRQEDDLKQRRARLQDRAKKVARI